MRRGELPAPDDDVQARRYRMADAALERRRAALVRDLQLGRVPGGPLRAQPGYWRSHDWWGLGPGAHSHVGGVRWWNVLHPGRYAERLAQGRSPAAARERLDAGAAADGAHAARASASPRASRSTVRTPPRLAGLLDPAALARGVARLTPDGRLLADHVARELLLAAPEAAEAQRERVPAQPVVDPDVRGRAAG